MASLNCSELPNPFTELAFLPPEIAFQTQVARYVLVGTTAAFIWDILSNSMNDYKLLFKQSFGVPTAVYFASRILGLFYCLISTIFDTTPAGHCEALEKILDLSFAFATSSTCLLFFFRIRAIFDRNKYIVSFFFVVWLAVLGGCLTIVFAVTATTIGPTKYCIHASIKLFSNAAGITTLIHDSLVFTAISWRLLLNTHADDNLTGRARAFFSGAYLPKFSKALLQSGQLYYLVSVGINLLNVIMVYVTSFPVPYRTMFTGPSIMLTNAMACHVFRSTKFGLIKDTTTSSIMTRSAQHASNGTNGTIPFTIRRNAIGNGDVHAGRILQDGILENIEITKTVDYVHDYPESFHSALPNSKGA